MQKGTRRASTDGYLVVVFKAVLNLIMRIKVVVLRAALSFWPKINLVKMEAKEMEKLFLMLRKN